MCIKYGFIGFYVSLSCFTFVIKHILNYLLSYCESALMFVDFFVYICKNY